MLLPARIVDDPAGVARQFAKAGCHAVVLAREAAEPLRAAVGWSFSPLNTTLFFDAHLVALLVSAPTSCRLPLGGASVGMSTSELLCGCQALVVTALAARSVLGRVWAAVGGESDARENKRKRKQE